MRDRQIVRSTVTSSSLFLSMGMAHFLGGAIPNFSFLPIIFWGFTFILLQKVDLHHLANSKLAALTLLFQVLGHISLSSNLSGSSFKMAISHLGCGITTFLVIRFGLNALDILERGLARFLPDPFSSFAADEFSITEVVRALSLDFLKLILDQTRLMRAPPMFATVRQLISAEYSILSSR